MANDDGGCWWPALALPLWSEASHAGISTHAHVYLVDTKGNKRMWHSSPMMVDLTPPPVEELNFPRVYPDRCAQP